MPVTDITDILQEFEPITLGEMESVKLMNRIDTKYAIPLTLLPELLHLAKDQYYAQQIGNRRIATYDTIYYDTADLEMYIRHHDRQLVRQKIRVRQYVESDLTFLEIKRKNNKGRTKKKRMPIQELSLDNATDEIREFLRSKSQYTLDDISKALRTEFERITLVNRLKTERLTIDLNLHWTNLRNLHDKRIPELVIVELKRDGNCPSPMLSIMNRLRVKPLKLSKYCIGTALTDEHVKRNRFKKKIRCISKLTNPTNQLLHNTL